MSEHCGGCADSECAAVTDGESAALRALYERMLDRNPSSRGGCAESAEQPRPPADRRRDDSKPAAAASLSSPMKRFEADMNTLLDGRTARRSADDAAAVPDPVLFRRCGVATAGPVNSSLYGLHVERAVAGPPANRDALFDAAESLLLAEAACKHGGAVHAAEIAATRQPEPKHAEDAARAGANAYAAAGQKPGADNSADTPIEVVGYVGCTRPRADPR